MEKLVRDKIPQIIEENDGVKPEIRVVRGEELEKFVIEKIHEEIGELLEASGDSCFSEGADVLEIIAKHASLKTGVSIEEAITRIEAARKDKKARRGAFEEGFVWKG